MAALIAARRAPLAIACLLAALAAALLLQRTPVVTDITAFLPGPADRTQALLAGQLRDGIASRTLLIGIEAQPAEARASSGAATGGYTASAGRAGDATDATGAARAGDGSEAALAALSTRLARALRADARFTLVANGDAAAVDAVRRVVAEHRYLLSPRIEPGAFAPERLHASLERLAGMLQSSLAPVIKPLAAADPTLELWHLAEGLLDRDQPATRRGVWFSADGRTALLVAQLRAPGSDIDAQQAALAALAAAFEAAVADWPSAGDRAGSGDRTGTGARASLGDRTEAGSRTGNRTESATWPEARPVLQVAGPAAFAAESRARIERDAKRLSALAAAAIALLLWRALGRAALLPLVAVPVLLGGLAGFSAVALAYGSVHGITIGFGMTLIGEAVDYAVYVLLQRRGTPADARLWRSLWLAVATSSLGFVAMVLSDFAGLAQLGLFSMAGICTAGAAARWLLPPWLPARPAAPAALPALLGRLLAALPRARVAVVALALAAAGLLASRGATLWNDELAALSPLPPQAGELDRRLREALGQPDLRMLIAVDGAGLQEALERAERLEPLLRTLAQDGVMAGHDSPVLLVPSARTQAARRAALPAAPELRTALAQAATGTPFEPRAFDPFVAAVQRARDGPLVDLQTYAGTPLAGQLAAQIVQADGRATVLIAARGVADPAMLRSRLMAAASPGLVVADLKTDLEALVARYRSRALLAAAGGAAAIVALLGWRLGRAGAALRMALALACAVALAAGAAVLIDGRLTLFHLVALLLVVGIGSNYALFFATAPEDAAQRAAVLGSVLLCAASTFVAFVLLAAASAPVLHIIGLTTALGTAASLLAAAALLGGASRPDIRPSPISTAQDR